MTGHGVRRQLTEEVNELKTLIVSSTRKKVPTTSCQNVGSQLNECEERRKGTATLNQDVIKKETTLQRVYSTRRSKRLTAKKSTEPGLIERDKSELVKIDSFL
ncbi:hypothetical protein Ccrd_009677, partial [Cynara cardunculus var. scolymus]